MTDERYTGRREEWESSMLELPNELFFSIMRTYLGSIGTPFHKPDLLKKLAAFLRKEETLHRIVSLIDEEDIVFLTAVYLFDRPGVETLYRLFEDELDYFDFHGRLRNLQERLLIYHVPHEDVVVLTPFLSEYLGTHIVSPELLFETDTSERSEESVEELSERGYEQSIPMITESLVWAAVSYLFTSNEVLKSDYTLKKKSAEYLNAVFSFSELEMRSLFGCMCRLELIELEENRLIPKREKIEDFSALSRPNRLSYIWAALISTLGVEGKELFRPPRSRSELTRRAEILRSFLETTSTQKSLNTKGLRRLLRFYALSQEEVPRHLPVDPEDMYRIGLLEKHSEGIRLSNWASNELEAMETSTPLLIQPDFTVTVQGPVDFRTGILIGETFDIRSLDVYPIFELTKSSYTRVRSRRFSSQELFDFLRRHSSAEMPHNVYTTITTWERAFSGIALYEGVVLHVDEERSHLVEHSPSLQPYILHSLGKGLYLLDPTCREEWSKILEQSGIEPLPPIRGPRDLSHSRDAEEKRAASFSTPKPVHSPFPSDFSSDDTFSEAGRILPSSADEEIREELRRSADGLTLGETRKKELYRYIDEKIILFPEQLGTHILSEEVYEARGIDYSGKVRIAEQSVSDKNALLEVVLRMPGGKPKRMLIRPEKLERGEKELFLRGLELPEGNPQRIPVGKLSYIKRWKSSLFVQRNELSRRRDEDRG